MTSGGDEVVVPPAPPVPVIRANAGGSGSNTHISVSCAVVLSDTVAAEQFEEIVIEKIGGEFSVMLMTMVEFTMDVFDRRVVVKFTLPLLSTVRDVGHCGRSFLGVTDTGTI